MQNDCIFCGIDQKGIIKKEQVLMSKDNFNVLLALHPATRGHSLVVPKEHYDSFAEIPAVLQALLFKTAINLGEKLKVKLGAKAYTVKVNDGLFKLEAGKGHVGHIHIHVIPRYNTHELLIDKPKKASLNNLKGVKKKILEYLK